MSNKLAQSQHTQQERQLAARIAQLEQIIYGRAVATVAEVIDGLIAMNQAAARGDPGARQNLMQLTQLLEQARVQAAGIVAVGALPNGRA